MGPEFKIGSHKQMRKHRKKALNASNPQKDLLFRCIRTLCAGVVSEPKLILGRVLDCFPFRMKADDSIQPFSLCLGGTGVQKREREREREREELRERNGTSPCLQGSVPGKGEIQSLHNAGIEVGGFDMCFVQHNKNGSQGTRGIHHFLKQQEKCEKQA